jgi:HlyD family secretion protein
MLRFQNWRRAVIPVGVVALVAALALWPETVSVDVETVTRGPLVVTIDEEGRTRVRDRFVVSSPVAGRVLRIDLETGDHVSRGDVIARLDAGAAPLLDTRSRADAQAAVDAARAHVDRAKAEEQRIHAMLAQAERELARAQRLIDGGALPAQERDARATDVRTASEAARAATAAVAVAEGELRRAQAMVTDGTTADMRVVSVRAPADGVILRRLRESEAMVPAGEPLMEIGDPEEIEVVADLLSTDAVRVREGARAIIEEAGSDERLAARVRRIEPSAFTKVSALGVEEQRVNVLLDFVDPGAEDASLGDAYRVDVRIVVWEAPAVIKVPTAALVRDQGQWAVYVVRAGRARVTPVEIGWQTGREAEVLQGLDDGDSVIVHPSDAVVDGARVARVSRS